jgi:hypothetical protein
MSTYNNGQLAHIWANESEVHGKNGNGSFYFTGSVIYSYNSSFPIAKIVMDNTVLFTIETYSTTTSQHCSNVRNAISHFDVFNVPCVEISIGTKHKYTIQRNKESHTENVNSYKKRIDALILQAAKARTNKDCLNDEALNLCNELNLYVDTFKLRFKHYVLPNSEDIKAKAAKAAKAKAAKAAKAKADIIRINKDRITRWLQGENLTLNFSIDTMLRIKGDVIETSRNASFPCSHGYIALIKIEQCKANSVKYEKNGSSIKLGHFNIDYIDVNGNVKAGCHNVKYQQIDRIANALREWRINSKVF